MTAAVLHFPRQSCHECNWQVPDVDVQTFAASSVAYALDATESKIAVRVKFTCPCGATSWEQEAEFDCLDVEVRT